MALDFPSILIVRELHLKVARRTGVSDTVFRDYKKLKEVFSEEDIIELFRLNDVNYMNSVFGLSFLGTIVDSSSLLDVLNLPIGFPVEDNEQIGPLLSMAKGRNKISNPFSFSDENTNDNEKELPYRFISLDGNKVLLVLTKGNLDMATNMSLLRDYLKLCYSRISIPTVNTTRAFALYFRLL